MPQKNVETVKGIYAEWGKGNFQVALPVLDRDITFETFMVQRSTRRALRSGPSGAGKVVRLLAHYDRDSALKAAGLRE